MAKYIPEGKRFQKGNKANPRGAGAHDPIKKALKKLTMHELSEIVNLVFFTEPNKLKEVANQDPTVLKSIIASAMVKAIQKGDLSQVNTLFDRFLGKAESKMHLTGTVSTVSKVVLTMPSNGSENPEAEE